MGTPKVSLRDLCREIGVEHIQATELLRRINRVCLGGAEVITQEIGTFRHSDRIERNRVLNGETFVVPAHRVVTLRYGDRIAPPAVIPIVSQGIPPSVTDAQFTIFLGSIEPTGQVNGFDFYELTFDVVANVPIGYEPTGNEFGTVSGTVNRVSVVVAGQELVALTDLEPPSSQLVVNPSGQFPVRVVDGRFLASLKIRFVDDGQTSGSQQPGFRINSFDVFGFELQLT